MFIFKLIITVFFSLWFGFVNASMIQVSDNESDSRSEKRYRDMERKNSSLQRELRAKESEREFDKIDAEHKKTIQDRMKWKPGDK